MVTFALSRVKGIHASQRVFERPARFDARAWFREAFGITRGDKVLKVRLRFSRHVATYIKEREWHPSQQLREEDDGRLEMRIETSGRKELIRWILSWTPEVEVLAPEELKTRIAEKLRQGLETAMGEV